MVHNVIRKTTRFTNFPIYHDILSFRFRILMKGKSIFTIRVITTNYNDVCFMIEVISGRWAFYRNKISLKIRCWLKVIVVPTNIIFKPFPKTLHNFLVDSFMKYFIFHWKSFQLIFLELNFSRQNLISLTIVCYLIDWLHIFMR